MGKKWKLAVALNNFCDIKAEKGRSLQRRGEDDPFFSDHKIGITRLGERSHGSPRETIIEATHDLDLNDYIYNKANWSSEIFATVDWGGFKLYMNTLPGTRQTNVIKITHDWIHDGHQNTLFSTKGEAHLCSAECGIAEAHQYYIACFAPPMMHQKSTCMRDLQKVFKKIEQLPPLLGH